MDGPRLPGAAPDSEDRIILHVDMDCFYASCERLREPQLEGKPVVVGMGYEAGEPHGAVATASYEAREHGIESAQAIRHALEALARKETADDDHAGPVGYYRTVDLDFYKSVAREVKAILHDCADVVREVSIDEAYLDVTDRTSWDLVGDDTAESEKHTSADDREDHVSASDHDSTRTLAEGYGRYIKQRISREVGVPASVGVAPNMSTAKVASDFDKPNGLTVVRPPDVRTFLEPLPVEEVHGVGPVTASELADLGIETAGDLAQADPTTLIERFGERGRELSERARGDDDRAVTPTGRPKSLSRESAFTEATADSEAKRDKISTLAAAVATRAKSRGAMYRTIGIKVVTPPFDVNTRASSLSGPVDDPDLVEQVACELLAEFDDARVRKLGVRVSNLSFGAQDQARLDGFESAENKHSALSAGTADDADSTRSNRTETTEQGGRITDWLTETQFQESVTEAEQKSTDREGQSSLGEFEQ